MTDVAAQARERAQVVVALKGWRESTEAKLARDVLALADAVDAYQARAEKAEQELEMESEIARALEFDVSELRKENASLRDALKAEQAKLVGYEAFQAAGTENLDGDTIWEFYDAKVWRSLLSWKEQAIAAERRVVDLEAALRRIERAHATAEHLQSIARDALLGQPATEGSRVPSRERAARASTRAAALEAALGFYADENTWKVALQDVAAGRDSLAESDRGHRARAVLGGESGAPQKEARSARGGESL